MIKTALKKLLVYCRKQKYKGWDNFDGLNSFVFKRSTFYKFRLIRLFWIQIFKRSPINLRKILAVPKGYNAKALSLFISGMVKLDLLKETKTLVEQLKHLAYKNKGLVCWGYNFPWQSRAFYAPIGTPNMIATVFAGNAFLDYYEKN